MIPLFAQGAFTASPNDTPDTIARKRAYIAAMMPKFGSARYVGEGIGQLATGVMIGRQNKKMDAAESEGRKSAEEMFGRLFGTANSAQSPDVQGPLSVLGLTPAEPAPPTDPNSPGAIAGDAMAALGKTVYTPGDKESFVAAMMPHAIKVSQMTGLDPRLVIAQAAQETGWGKSAPGNNFFGIKSHGKAGGNTFATNEVINGKTVRINDSFRGYDSMGDSVMGYAEFLQENPRYKEMLAAGDLEGQIAALGRSGYATDPNYAASVRNIALGIGLPEGFTPGQANTTAPGTAAVSAPSAPAIPINELYMALQNPWLSDAQRGLIGSMIEEQQQASDPLRQLELRKAEIELAQLENPTQQPPEDFTARMFTLNSLGIDPQSEEGKVYLMTGELPEPPEPGYRGLTQEEAARLPKGADPNEYQVSPEGKIEKIGGGGVTVNNNTGMGVEPLGTEGQILVPDPTQPSGYRVELAPGSKLDQERKAAEEKAGKKSGNAATASEVVTTAAERALAASRERAFGGFGQGLVANLPWTDSAEVARQVDTLKANAKIDNLQAMRDASQTGGALGSVTEGETQMLAAKSGALDPSSPNFERDLADYTRTLLRVVHGPEQGDMIFAETWKGAMPEGATPKPQQAASDAPVVGTVEDGWEYIGGDPAKPESWRKVRQ